MIHEGNITGTDEDSYVVAVSGHAGFVGSIIALELKNRGINYYKIPSYRELSPKELDSLAPKGKIVLINCSGSTPKRDLELNRDIFKNNVEGLEKLINAFGNRLHSVLHMSTMHLNFPEKVTEYTKAKLYAEEYLNQQSAERSFIGLNLRLPTVWSSHQLKEESLLDDITNINVEEMMSTIRSPDSIVQIAPGKSLGIQVLQFLGNDLRKIGFNESNCWIGEINQLIELLETKNSSVSWVENDLKQIFQHWRLRRLKT
jgi:hypothetical protein